MSVALEAARAHIGWSCPPRTFVVSADHIRRFAQAIGDDDSRWQLEAPPTFSAAFLEEPPPMPPGLMFGESWLNGADAWDFVEPLRAGDSICCRTSLVDAFEKQGSSGVLLFLIYETEFRKESGQVAVRHRATRIRR